MKGKTRNSIVTIVIPVYNVECYLDRCLESVIKQTYSDLEIILVDDCSPDGCPRLCDEWAKRDKRISVIHKPVNEGLGMARNTGLKKASGEYVFFFDSDDYIAQDTVEKCVKEAKETDAQIVCYGTYYVNREGEITGQRIPSLEQRFFEGRQVQEVFLPDLIAPNPDRKEIPGLLMSACTLMYSVQLLRETNWEFVSEREIISEDVYSLLALCQHVQRVAVIPEGFYHYCENASSLTHSYRRDRIGKIQHFYLEAMELCERCGYLQVVRQRLSLPYLVFIVAALKQEVARECGFIEQYRTIKQIIADRVLQETLRENHWKKLSITRRVLFAMMRNRHYLACWVLLKAKA